MRHFHAWKLKLTLALVALVSTMAVPWLPGEALASNLSPNFPRLATIYSKSGMNTAAAQAAIAKFNLYVTDPVNWPAADNGVASGTIGQHLKALNPNMIAVIYEHSIMTSDTDGAWVVNGSTYYIDPRWLLTYAGSSLSSSITSSATSIPVRDLSKFAVNDRVMIGGGSGQTRAEVAKVTGRSASSGAGTLTVVRAASLAQGGKFGAIAHNSGDWVRSIAYAFNSPGGAMLLNPTTSSPSSSINASLGSETWNQFLASYIRLSTSGSAFSNLDGVFLDNFVDKSLQLIDRISGVDSGNTNVATGMNDTLWQPGMAALASNVRADLPSGWTLMANTGGQNQPLMGSALGGGMIEGLSQNGASLQGNTSGALSFYNGWMASGKAPETFIMNTGASASSMSGAQTNYQAMRFLLALTLTNNGYFSYDEFNYNGGHQSTWWYDEYDNAGKGVGYLGQPLGAATQPVSGVYRRDFNNGISLANTTGSAVTVSLGGTFQKIKGTQAPTVNNGALVTSVTLQPNDGIILLRSGASGVPTAPSNLKGTAASTSISLGWTASTTSGVTYNVYRGLMPGTETLYQSGTTSPSFTDTNMPNTGYWYKVTAKNSAGESAASNEVLIYKSGTSSSGGGTGSGSTGVPSAPSNMKLTASPGKVTVSWTASATSGVTYDIYRGYTNTSEVLVASGISGTSYGDTNLTSVGYWYAVKAKNSSGESAPSNQALIYIYPGAPSNLKGTPSTTKITLNWTASPTTGATYDVYRGNMPGSETKYASGISGTTYTDGSLSQRGYWYKVVAVSPAGLSSFSNEVLVYHT